MVRTPVGEKNIPAKTLEVEVLVYVEICLRFAQRHDERCVTFGFQVETIHAFVANPALLNSFVGSGYCRRL